jgi:hypothetical protein
MAPEPGADLDQPFAQSRERLRQGQRGHDLARLSARGPVAAERPAEQPRPLDAFLPSLTCCSAVPWPLWNSITPLGRPAEVGRVPPEHRLPEQPAQLVGAVPTAPAVEEFCGRHVGAPEDVKTDRRRR